jgi:hypothetical protein
MIDISKIALRMTTHQVQGCQLFLYSMTTGDMVKVKAFDIQDEKGWFLNLLELIGSFEKHDSPKTKREPLPREFLTRLTADERNSIAEKCISPLLLLPSLTSNSKKILRGNSEDAIAYLARLVPERISEQDQNTQTQFKTIAKQPNSPFKDLLVSSSKLRDSLRSFESDTFTDQNDRLMRRAPEMLANQTQHHDHMRKERREEIDTTSLTADMTTKSAAALSDLIAVAGVFMQRFDERSVSADRDTRKHLMIALCGIGISGILAAIALGFSIAAYFQDTENNRSNYKWQNDTTKLLRDSAELAAKQLDVTSKLTAPTQSHNQIPQQTEQSRRRP